MSSEWVGYVAKLRLETTLEQRRAWLEALPNELERIERWEDNGQRKRARERLMNTKRAIEESMK